MRGDFGTRKTGSFERSCPADVSSDSLSLRKNGQPLPLVRLVRRPAVQRAITSALDRDSLVVLCAEPGLGAHCVSRLVGTSYVDAGLEAIRVKLNVKSASAICRRISKSVSRIVEMSQGLGSQPSGLLVLDGFNIVDEGIAARAAKHIAGAILAGVHVLVLMSPDYSYLIDYLPHCRIFGARDLVLTGSEMRKWCGKKSGLSFETIKAASHGIPALVDVIRTGEMALRAGSFPGGWDDCAFELYMAALRPNLISEEWLIRFAMCAFGSGNLDHLRACGVRVSSDLANEIAQGCPLLGLRLDSGSFDCVCMSEPAIVRVLSQAMDQVPRGSQILPDIVMMLMSQGRYRRAGMLASLCSGSSLVAGRALDHPLELIDAGHLGLVITVSNECAQDIDSVARIVLDVLGVPSPKNRIRGIAPGNSRAIPRKTELHVRLLELCRGIESEASLAEIASSLDELEPEVLKLDDPLSSKLYHHVRSLLLAMNGASLEAFRELVLVQELREQPNEGPSLFSALLCRDFEMLGLIIGSPVSQRDSVLFRAASKLLAEAGMTALAEQARAMCELSEIVAGERKDIENENRVLIRWRTSGKTRLVMWGNSLLSLGYSLRGQFQHAHVRASEAMRISERLEEGDALALARMAERCALRGLGERVSLDAVNPNMACSPDMSALDRFHALTGSEDEAAPDDMMLEMRGISPRNGVMAIASRVSDADRAHGAKMAEKLPLSWKGAAPSRAHMVPARSRQRRSMPGSDTGAHLNISVLGGGVAAWKDGIRIPERNWTRRQAKMLLALLALAPGHLIQRHEAIGLLWPDSDLARGRESLYTVLSSLRSTLGQTTSDNRFVLGELGQIWLDDELVSCDVDEFERIARHVVSRKAEDSEVIALCVALEGMYNGGSYVPPNDSTGRFRDRHEELARRYRDAMLAGVEAATRLRDAHQAAWFAQSAKRIG